MTRGDSPHPACCCNQLDSHFQRPGPLHGDGWAGFSRGSFWAITLCSPFDLSETQAGAPRASRPGALGQLSRGRPCSHSTSVRPGPPGRAATPNPSTPTLCSLPGLLLPGRPLGGTGSTPRCFSSCTHPASSEPEVFAQAMQYLQAPCHCSPFLPRLSSHRPVCPTSSRHVRNFGWSFVTWAGLAKRPSSLGEGLGLLCRSPG